MFKKGQTVRLKNDLLHYRSIFNNSMTETPEVTVQLKAGRELTVNAHYADGDVECERKGGYYYIDANDLELV